MESDVTEIKSNRYAYVKPNNAVKELQRTFDMSASLLDGGPEAYVVNFASFAQGDPTLIVSLHGNDPTSYKLEHESKWVRSYYWRSGASVGTLVSRIATVAKVLAQLIRFRPTHVLCWQTNLPLWSVYLTSRILGAVFVVSRHTRFPQSNEPWYRRITGSLDRWVVRRARAVVCHGPFLREETLALGVSDRSVVEFSWGFQHFNANPTTDGPDLTDGGRIRLITYVGRLFKLKGVFDLLSACMDRLRHDAELRLVYVGDGPDRVELAQRIRENGLEHAVRIMGRVPHTELPAILAQSTVCVTPTRAQFPEGRCMAAIESLIMGVPLVAPRFGPFLHLVRHGESGLLYEPDSTADLRRCIDMVLDDDQLEARLRSGAAEDGERLRNPPMTFSTALEVAFEYCKSVSEPT